MSGAAQVARDVPQNTSGHRLPAMDDITDILSPITELCLARCAMGMDGFAAPYPAIKNNTAAKRP